MKKVIIGLAIFVCAMFVEKNITSADELPKVYGKVSFYSSSSSLNISSNPLDSNYTYFENVNINNKISLSINFSDKLNPPKNRSIVLYDSYYMRYYFLHFNISLENWYGDEIPYLDEVNIVYTNNNYEMNTVLNGKTVTENYHNYPLILSNSSVSGWKTFDVDNKKFSYKLASDLHQERSGCLYRFNNSNVLKNLSVVWKSSNFPKTLKWTVEGQEINDETIDDNPTDKLTELDMNNKYAVLFYPKEYNLLEKTCSKYKPGVETDDDGNVTVIPNAECVDEKYKFEFKQKGKFSFGFADLNTMDVVTAPLDLTSSFNEYLSFENYLETDEFKGGLIFYNRNLNQTTDDDGNVTISYGIGSIKYNSDFYNYLIINDKLDKINETICLKDKNNKEKCYNIKNIPGAYDTADKKINNDTDSLNDFDYKNKLDNFIDNLKDSFEFLKENMKLFLNKVPPIIYLYIIVIPLFLLLFKMMK